MVERAGGKSMRRAGRKRRVAGWAFVVFGAVVTVVWAASIWWRFGWDNAAWRFGMYRGRLGISTADPPTPLAPSARGWYGEHDPVNWGCDWLTPGLDQARVTGTVSIAELNLGVAAAGRITLGPMTIRVGQVVLWPVAVVALGAGALLIRSARRARDAAAGCCGGCGYNLVGLGAGVVCPECGAKAQTPR